MSSSSSFVDAPVSDGRANSVPSHEQEKGSGFFKLQGIEVLLVRVTMRPGGRPRVVSDLQKKPDPFSSLIRKEA